MKLLYEEIGLADKRLQRIVARAALDVIMSRHDEDDTVQELSSEQRHKLNDEFKEGLKFLQENEIVRFSEADILYRVVVLNRYRLDQLVGELMWLETYLEGVSSELPPPRDDVALYERSTGNIMINGTRKTLKGINKKLFDALFIASPEYANRSALLKAIGSKNTGQASSKVALNEAFSNLRKACGVTSQTISLGRHGGRLNARASVLIEEDETYLSNFLTGNLFTG